ncbi:ABC-2 type transport system ATP-binding protein [Actinoalloteichus hoggarensis]|uniref:Doxorubicin resistance ATP-binding protein DrrA n=1 Tax=Actinoalloteichus hoggarensis TaxID=1470176 RepID=A0A221W004_9PSEU|nr:ATP-binding cassette domain-containing protein [Actinoalloteichus hoggarensis]ASO19093.1 Doxorubicin resistance ATP-binding protein DrrA [Actinoalloteichus hoggarensis]MBB5920330.1 ABC-2 type transport system ATP-binding protein [Actinoalloteichus hoggarensis]
MTASETVIETVDLGRRFGTVTALTGVNLAVRRGSVLGLLGHNGAGKTTLVNILGTLVRPTSGRARIAGLDVVDQAAQVRSRIGLTGQFAALDERISGLDNLVVIGRLLGAGRRAARRRADELLELFDLTAVATRQARAYSGGMRRRLDLALGLVGRPEVIVLDEPTTGMDPTSRLSLWQTVAEMARDGSTVLLTTQYLDEADRLADVITVLAGGRVVATGTPDELKARVGRRAVTVRLLEEDTARALDALRAAGLHPVRGEGAGAGLTVAVEAAREITAVVRALDTAGIEAQELGLTEPGLDEVYLFVMNNGAAHAG